jgi:transglutaminase superfamily protein
LETSPIETNLSAGRRGNLDRSPTASLATTGPCGDTVRVPSALWCAVVITWIKILLTTRGFPGTIDWIQRRTQHIALRSVVRLDGIRSAERAVATAGALYPARALCLEQSLTLYFLLRGQGVGVRYCQGVKPHPFQAHAWIEYHGEVVNDIAEHTRLFTQLPGQLP